MRTKLKFGLSQVNNYAPRWLINATSIIALAIAARHHLISELPLLSGQDKEIVMAWANYVLDTLQVALAVAVIFFGEHKSEEHDTAGN